MKKVMLIVLVILVGVIGGAAYVGYTLLQTVKSAVASGCGNGCVREDHGGPIVLGSGHVTTESRQVAKFTSIRLESSANVEIDRTGTESLSVTGDDNLLAFFTSEVKDGTLYLAYAKDKSFQGKLPVYRVTVADLRDIQIRGSGDLQVASFDGAALSASIAGSGDMRLAGRTDDLTLSIAGSGNIDAAGLKAKRAQVSISGSGDATVNATDALDVRISGSGDLRYLGAPKLTQNVSGSGSVRQK